MTKHPEQSGSEQPEQSGSEQPAGPMSRRGMLRYGAIAAAAAAGAAGAAGAATPAQAAPGDAVKIDDATNAGAGTTKVTGSSLEINAGNAASGETAVEKAAVIGRATGFPRVGVLGVGAGTTGAGLAAINHSGPQLQLSVSEAEFFPPKTGTYVVGAILNWWGELYQCVESDGTPDSRTTWLGLSNTEQLRLLPQPVRVYSSKADTSAGGAKITQGSTRTVKALLTPAGTPSGVPPWATAVAATVQLEATEGNLGWLAIASGDVPKPGGFSTTVWSTPNFAGVTSFTSALSTPDTNRGKLSVACYSSIATAKTHFYIDVVGYYGADVWFGGPDAAQRSVKGNFRNSGVSVARKRRPQGRKR